MENKMTLYQINAEIERLGDELWDTCDKETGEMDRELLARFEALQLKKEDKIKGCIYLIKKFEGTLDLIDKEIERLKGLRERAKKSMEGISRLLANVIPIGQKMDLGTVGISWRKSNALIIENEEEKKADLTDQIKGLFKEWLDVNPTKFLQICKDFSPFIKIKITIEFDKKSMKEAIKDGMTIDGVYIEERENLKAS